MSNIKLMCGDCLELMRDIPDNSIDMIFCDLPYAEDLYKYEWVWQKDNGTNAPNVNLQPFRVHEFVYIFGKGRVTNGTRIPMKYFPQKTEGVPYSQQSGRMSDNWKGGLGTVVTQNTTGARHPLTVQKFARDSEKLHPTQKPLALLEFLIKTYTVEGDTVLDNCFGSGTTALACYNTGRNFIGMELNKEYYDIASQRLDAAKLGIPIVISKNSGKSKSLF